jgi:hypothetical protein
VDPFSSKYCKFQEPATFFLGKPTDACVMLFLIIFLTLTCPDFLSRQGIGHEGFQHVDDEVRFHSVSTEVAIEASPDQHVIISTKSGVPWL